MKQEDYIRFAHMLRNRRTELLANTGTNSTTMELLGQIRELNYMVGAVAMVFTADNPKFRYDMFCDSCGAR